MSDKQYIDIKVIDGGWQMDAGQQPDKCSDLFSVAQDVKHSIMESGLLRLIQAERNPVLRTDIMIQIEQLAEVDTRIVPGSAAVVEGCAGNMILTADTYDFGSTTPIELNT